MSNRPTHYNTRYKHDLSPREKEVLSLVTKGQTNAEIAQSLGLAFDTVKMHVSGVLAKLDVSSRDEAAAYWRDYNSLGSRIGRAWNALVGVATTKAVGIAGASVAVVAASIIVAVTLALVLNGDTNKPEVENAEPVLPPPGPRIEAVIPLRAPILWDFAYADGALWGREHDIAEGEAKTLQKLTEQDALFRIDVKTGAVTEIPVGPIGGGVIASGDRLWTPAPWNNSLTEVDAKTATVRRVVPLPIPQRPGFALFLHAAGDDLWVMAFHQSTVLRLSMATGEVKAQATLAQPGRATLAFGSLWVPMAGDGSVARLDPLTLEVQATIPLGLIGTDPNCGPCTAAVLQSGAFLWAFSETPVELSKIDPATNEVLQHAPLGATNANLFANAAVQTDANGDIWFANPGGVNRIGELIRFDVRTGTMGKRIELRTMPGMLIGHPTVSPSGVIVEGNNVWIPTAEKQVIQVQLR